MKSRIVFRSYEPQRDEAQAYQLWRHTLGHVWPLPYETFHAVTVGNAAYQQGDHFVAQSDHEVVGFIATRVSERQGHVLSPPTRSNLVVILVAPGHQRQGIGSALHTHALLALKQRGVEDVRLGGGSFYFWQGAPTNLPGAWPFFQACGWTEQERSFDLLGELGGYATPPGIYERLHPAITIGLATPADNAAVLEFERRHFPGWLPFYQRVLQHDGYGDVVVAKDTREGIVGASSVVDPHAAWWQHDMRWLRLFGASTGGVGPLGVAEPVRGQGIGLALAARVTELLRERGFAQSYIGWTQLADWYGRLGYQIWQEYVMSWKRV